MFSGQINGISWEDYQADTDGPGTAAGDPPSGGEAYAGILVPTVVRMSQDALDYWTGVTCLFNKYWYPEAERLTLPFCFFHITKYVERQKVEASKKRVILYEPPSNTGESTGNQADPIRPGVMQTITDNRVVQPKEYQMDIIVPYMPVSRHIKEGRSVMNGFINNIKDITGEFPSSETRVWINSQFSRVSEMLAHAYRAEVTQDILLKANKGSMAGTDCMVNKNSLDAMVESGQILTFKTWLGSDYKYVMITDKTAEKKSTEDEVWRVSLTCEELPVLSIAPVQGDTGTIDKGWVLEAVKALGPVSGLKEYTVPALSNAQKAVGG